MPPIGYRVCSALRRCRTPIDIPPLSAKPLAATSSPEPLAPAGLCCPGHHRLSASSASLEISVSFPGAAGYRTRSSTFRIILSDPQNLSDFRCCTFEYCRLQYAGSPDACTSVLPHQHRPSGRKEALGSSVYPANQLHVQEVPFRRLIRSLSLRPYSLLAPRLIRQERHDNLSVPQDFYFRASRSQGRPMRLPDMTTEPN